MGIELIGRTIIFNDTLTNVEAENGALAELSFGRNTATGALGYTVDGGVTWVWLPVVNGVARSGSTTDGHMVVWDGTNADSIKDGGVASTGTSGGGDVYGSASVTDGHMAVFDTDGYHIKDGGAVPTGTSSGSGDYVKLDEVVRATDGAIAFSNISGSYKHLRIVILGRTDRAGQTNDQIRMTVNSDGDANYTDSSSSTNYIVAGYVAGATATANYAYPVIIDIPGYSQTTFYKSVVGISNQGSSLAGLISTGIWKNTGAITSIQLGIIGSNWKTGSIATLFGLT